MYTIDELVAVCPSIEVVSALEYAKEMLVEMLDNYDVDYLSVQAYPWIMSDSDRVKWTDFLRKYLNAGGRIEGLIDYNTSEGAMPPH